MLTVLLVLTSGLCGVGAVIRDSYGRLCGAVAMRAPSLLLVLATELYALKNGTFFALDASFSPLLGVCDSLSAIQLLNKEETCYRVEGALVEDLRWLLASSLSLSTRFVPHTANGVADCFKRFSLGQEDLSF